MNNRRNYYRILHVQPEAPFEIIKASYRSLMTKLKAHPDLGGDHESASLINQAYAVLSDPQKRKNYDVQLALQGNKTPGVHAYHYHRHPQHEAGPGTSEPSKWHCYFCGTTPITAQKECGTCFSPLTPVKSAAAQPKYELFGRRKGPRISKTATVKVYPSWPHSGHLARLNDLSATGFSLHTNHALKTGQIVKLDSSFLKGVAKVVSVRTNGAYFSVHLNLVTAQFISQTGTFVREKA